MSPRMAILEALGPWQYRKFMRFAAVACRFIYWLFAFGILITAAVALTGSRATVQDRMLFAVALTLGPAIAGWLAITGCSVLWALLLGWNRTAKASMWNMTVSVALPLMGGATCLALASWLSFRILRYVFHS